ncbi:iron reductase domain protein [Venturia nashicola]|uniref:Iron reductase domain protein n=1 Tax=Venturia nashicola TaxID=86259 RepID=A0A4Z1PSA3_9PEZI|nr:iron reductase domain protein [Venturia nashicola]
MLVITIACSLLALFLSVAAQSTQNASTFVFKSDAATLSLSLTAVVQTGDLFFRLSAPAEYDWVGFGIGHRMKGALTFITYPCKNGSAVTVSPRLSSGHTEPEYSPKIHVEKISAANVTASNFIDASQGGQMLVSFVCRNCTKWSDPPLDLTATDAPFIFAAGPVSDGTPNRWSDSPAAPLRSHSIHAKFTMDMRVATVQSEDGITIPELANATVGASGVTDVQLKLHDWTSAIHAISMCLAFGLFYPLDALITRLFHSKTRKIHITTQSFIFLLLLTGISLGFSISTQFVRSKKISSPHQVLGIITLILYLTQIPLGILLRRTQGPQDPPQNQAVTPIAYQLKSKMQIKRFILAHRLLALLVFVLGLTNVGLGFNFALAANYNKFWVPMALALVLLWFLGVGFRYMCVSSRKDGKGDEDFEERMRKAYAEYAAGQDVRKAQNGFGHGQSPQYEMSDLGKNGAEVRVEQYEIPVQRSY